MIRLVPKYYNGLTSSQRSLAILRYMFIKTTDWIKSLAADELICCFDKHVTKYRKTTWIVYNKGTGILTYFGSSRNNFSNGHSHNPFTPLIRCTKLLFSIRCTQH